MYVPRFYGESNYGIANSTKLVNYTPININFNGDLRDYQVDIVNKYISHVNQVVRSWWRWSIRDWLWKR